MSKANQRSDRISQRIAASQARLERDGESLPAVPRSEKLPDAYPPENYRGLAAEYPWLTVVAGLGLGILVGALLPRNAGGKTGRRMMGLATAAAELGLAFSKQARDKAESGAREGLHLIEDSTAPLRKRASSGARSARKQGVRLVGEAVKLAALLRK